MRKNEITSIGWLHNHDGSVALSLCAGAIHAFVTVPRQEFESVGGVEAIKDNKQVAIDFIEKYGFGRPVGG